MLYSFKIFKIPGDIIEVKEFVIVLNEEEKPFVFELNALPMLLKNSHNILD